MVKILIMTNNHDFSVILDSCINRMRLRFCLLKRKMYLIKGLVINQQNKIRNKDKRRNFTDRQHPAGKFD